jgi:hypothetical protein
MTDMKKPQIRKSLMQNKRENRTQRCEMTAEHRKVEEDNCLKPNLNSRQENTESAKCTKERWKSRMKISQRIKTKWRKNEKFRKKIIATEGKEDLTYL